MKKLMALGHSKTKAAKALKDCGNNFTQAKSLLDQTAAEKERQTKLEEKARQREKEESERRKNEEERRSVQQLVGLFQPNNDSSAEQQQQQLQAAGKRIKLHPCIVQYRSCRYGKFCLLKDFPGDTCINYFHGDCIYGSGCRNRHSINGVDLREFVRQAQQEEESLLKREANGAAVYLTESLGGGVLIGERVVPEQQHDDRPIPLPQAHMWNVSAGSEPSYTDPLVESVMQQLCDDDDGLMAPAPFLEKVRQPKSGQQRAPVVVVGSDVSPLLLHQQSPLLDLSMMQHPCIAQCGGCKYGDGCLHAHKRADICVFFLNGRCSFPAEQCRYRHDSGAATAPPPPPSTTSPPMSFVLKPNAVIGGQSMWGLHDGAVSRRELEARELERMYAPPLAMSQLGGQQLSSPLPFQVPPNSPFVPLHAAYGQSPTSPQLRRGPPPLTKEDEQNAFEALHAVFPSVPPSLLLHSIRQSNGDRQQVANMIVSFPSTAELQRQLDSLLEAEGTTKEPDSSTNVLLTLCHLFPHVEVDVIIGALQSASGDYGEAFYTLTCSAEHVTHDTQSDWSGDASVSDQLKLHKLYAMFTDLPKEVIDACFAQSASSTPATVEVLNQLTSGSLVTEEERQVRGNESTTFVVTSPCQNPEQTSQLASPNDFASSPQISQSQLYLETAKEVGENCDWRRVRQEAYAVNKCRITILCHASAAFHRGDGHTAKVLSIRARELRSKYEKLNMLAMHALERERQGESLSTLDLHGFHVDEAVDVVRKRLSLCATQHVRRVRIVVGEGRHSSKGQSTVYPAVYEELQRRPHAVRIVSVRPAYIDVELVPGSL